MYKLMFAYDGLYLGFAFFAIGVRSTNASSSQAFGAAVVDISTRDQHLALLHNKVMILNASNLSLKFLSICFRQGMCAYS